MKICAYVMSAYAKQTYSQESHDVRAWPGFEMILDALRRAGETVIYAGSATVHEYDIVLVSITSDCDWWPFVGERVTWKQSKQVVIAGGAGVLNVRPFLGFVDAFVLGRAEELLPEMVNRLRDGEQWQYESIVWSDRFNKDGQWKIYQADKPYPHSFMLTNGKRFIEASIGCPNKCLFCGYTWHRRYIGDGTFTAGAESMSAGNREHTIRDLLKIPAEHWQDSGPLRIVGLDGFSERLRMMVNKRISREGLRRFLRGLGSINKPHQVKLYSIVGYPTETESDWQEFIEDLSAVDAEFKSGKQWSLLVHITPFRAMPATPSATWEMSGINYRGRLAHILRKPGMKGNIFFQGNRFWAVEGMGTDSLASVIHSAICLRGTETDADAFKAVACSHRYWSSNSKQKAATLKQWFDVDRLLGAFTDDNLPTKYLTGYVRESCLKRLSKRCSPNVAPSPK